MGEVRERAFLLKGRILTKKWCSESLGHHQEIADSPVCLDYMIYPRKMSRGKTDINWPWVICEEIWILFCK